MSQGRIKHQRPEAFLWLCAGEENLSVVVAPIAGGFKLKNLGGPRQAAERFLSTTVAPEGSGRTADLIDAYERCAVTKHD